MGDERRRILDLLAEGKISASEAEGLLNALSVGGDGSAAQPVDPGHGDSEADADAPKRKPDFLRVLVAPSDEKAEGDRVNIRVPLALIRAGVQLQSLLPGDAKVQVGDALKNKGVHLDLAGANPAAADEIIDALADFSLEVNEPNGDNVRIFCE